MNSSFFPELGYFHTEFTARKQRQMASKATKKTAPPKKDLKEAVIEAAFTLAGQLGWRHVTLNDIAEESGYTLADLYDHFSDKGDILAAYERSLKKQVLMGALNDNMNDARDILFDLLMDRFDTLNQHRAALLSILAAYKTDPKEPLLALPYLGRSMAWMLEAAGIDTGGWKGAARIAGLSAVYLAALRVWMNDNSSDLAKTMAALDKNLSRAEDWASRLAF